MVPRGQWRAAKVSAAHGKPAKAKREAMLAFWIAALGDGDPIQPRLAALNTAAASSGRLRKITASNSARLRFT